MRDSIYVKDAVDVTLHFAMQPAIASGGLFNYVTGEPRTWLALVNEVFSLMGKEPRAEFIDMPEKLRRTYRFSEQAKVQKLRAAGYKKPFTSLEDGVREYIQTYYLPCGE
jgi:ADP-L-glycero-D-manno-heptose 6-epimerase